MRKKPTQEELLNRKCPICGEGHTEGKKWIIAPNKFLPSEIKDGMAVCLKHYQQAHTSWRFQNKLKGNEEHYIKRRKYENSRYATDKEFRENLIFHTKKRSKLEEVKNKKREYAKTEQGKCASRIRNKRYYDKDPEKQSLRIKNLATNPHRQYTYIKRRAKKSNIKFELTLEDFIKIRSSGKCHYCKVELSKTAPSIDRLDSSKGYVKDNCVPCCVRCNLIKKDILTPEEMLMFHAILKGEKDPLSMDKHILYIPNKKATIRKRWGRLVSRSQKESIPLELTFEQYKEIITQPCEYCGVENAGTGYGIDKIIPSNEIGYTLSNSVSCCSICNNIKSNLLSYEEMKLMISIIAYYRRSKV